MGSHPDVTVRLVHSIKAALLLHNHQITRHVFRFKGSNAAAAVATAHQAAWYHCIAMVIISRQFH
jgi:hypothetical protein